MAALKNHNDEPPGDGDSIDLTLPGGGAIKLWQLFAIMFTLFAAHYTLVKITIAEANKDLKYELLMAQQTLNNSVAETQRRLANLEDFDRSIISRLTAHENDDRDRDRRISIIEERQHQVMTKLGMTR